MLEGPAALLIGKSFMIGSNSSNVIGIINLSIVFLTDMLARTVKFNPASGIGSNGLYRSGELPVLPIFL